MRNYVNLAVPTMPLLVADKMGAAETKIIASFSFRLRERQRRGRADEEDRRELC